MSGSAALVAVEIEALGSDHEGNGYTTIEQAIGLGDLLYVEAGRDHVLASDDLESTDQTSKFSTLLLCGYCEFEAPITHPLMKIWNN